MLSSIWPRFSRVSLPLVFESLRSSDQFELPQWVKSSRLRQSATTAAPRGIAEGICKKADIAAEKPAPVIDAGWPKPVFVTGFGLREHGLARVRGRGVKKIRKTGLERSLWRS